MHLMAETDVQTKTDHLLEMMQLHPPLAPSALCHLLAKAIFENRRTGTRARPAREYETWEWARKHDQWLTIGAWDEARSCLVALGITPPGPPRLFQIGCR